MKKMKRQNGFTIIEVVLVLAIAGLIFLMVFIALPALQRSQKDQQRENDLSRLQGAIQSYQSNNRGRTPGVDGAMDSVTTDDAEDMSTDPTAVASDRSWKSFYARYLMVGTDGVSDSFEDPEGGWYGLAVSECAGECTQPPATWAEQAETHAITVVMNATCDGETIVPSTGSRRIAMAYKLEGGGISCMMN